jgi:iron complex transport system substrate-binding protein
MLHVKKLTSRNFLFALIMLLLLTVVTACATSDQESSTAGSLSEANAEDSEADQENEENELEERTIQHSFGETAIETEPVNVAVLHPYFIDFLLSIGIQPGSAPSAGPNEDGFTWYFEDQLGDTTNLGWQVEPSLETILAAEPDLILAADHHEKGYDSLSKIAPTVAIAEEETEEGVKDWRATLLKTAEVFGKEAEAKEVIEKYNAEATEATGKIKGVIGDETVMFLRITDKELRYYGQKNFDVLYGDLGLQEPPYFPDNTSAFAPLSMEKLPEIDPDHIFVLVQSEEKLEEIQNSSLWENLTAVKRGQIYPVDYALWFQGFGPIANELIMEEAVETLTN